MAEAPWLTIVGLGEDGPAGLPPASRAALDAAEVVMGPARHLGLLPDLGAERVAWPVPFADGRPVLERLRGRAVVVLASGDPFWFGAGSVLARWFDRSEWRALPGPSTFSLVAARLGWPLEGVTCLGLHAAPLTRLRPHLAEGARLIVLLRDGAAVRDLAALLHEAGFAESRLQVMEAVGGPRENSRSFTAQNTDFPVFTHPVCVAIEAIGGPALPRAAGRADTWFEHDGQITKRPVRALTLSALAPVAGEHLWDIGAGSGSISIEWLLAHPDMRATAIEGNPDRAARIAANAARLGVDRLTVIEGRAPQALDGLDRPDAIFVGGGLSDAMLNRIWIQAPAGVRLVANAVTLGSQAVLTAWHARKGGDLLRIDLAEASPLGSHSGWKPAYPLVQWRVTL